MGRALDLPVVQQTTNAAGQTVKQVRDTAGSILELTLDKSGQVVNSRVLSQGTTGASTSGTSVPPAPMPSTR